MRVISINYESLRSPEEIEQIRIFMEQRGYCLIDRTAKGRHVFLDFEENPYIKGRGDEILLEDLNQLPVKGQLRGVVSLL